MKDQNFQENMLKQSRKKAEITVLSFIYRSPVHGLSPESQIQISTLKCLLACSSPLQEGMRVVVFLALFSFDVLLVYFSCKFCAFQGFGLFGTELPDMKIPFLWARGSLLFAEEARKRGPGSFAAQRRLKSCSLFFSLSLLLYIYIYIHCWHQNHYIQKTILRGIFFCNVIGCKYIMKIFQELICVV